MTGRIQRNPSTGRIIRRASTGRILRVERECQLCADNSFITPKWLDLTLASWTDCAGCRQSIIIGNNYYAMKTNGVAATINGKYRLPYVSPCTWELTVSDSFGSVEIFFNSSLLPADCSGDEELMTISLDQLYLWVDIYTDGKARITVRLSGLDSNSERQDFDIVEATSHWTVDVTSECFNIATTTPSVATRCLDEEGWPIPDETVSDCDCSQLQKSSGGSYTFSGQLCVPGTVAIEPVFVE